MKAEVFKDKRFPKLAGGKGRKAFRSSRAAEEIDRHVSGVIDSEFIGGFMKSVSSC